MFKHLLIVIISIVLSSSIHAQEGSSNSLPGMMLLNKYVTFSTTLGAAQTQCTTLTEAIINGWPNARLQMISKLVSAGMPQEKASFILDRAYISAKNAADQQNIITDCDVVLTQIYSFEQE